MGQEATTETGSQYVPFGPILSMFVIFANASHK